MGDWTVKLGLCCLAVGLASFQFGYNIASLNTPSDFIKAFMSSKSEFYAKNVESVWTLLNCLFIIGGMLGAIGSKFVLSWIGRRLGLIYNNMFSVVGSVLAFICTYVGSAECILISRVLFGLQAGFAISVVPIYLSEISSHKIRGEIGTVNEISIAFGIVVSQILGLNQLLGSSNLWNVLLAGPIVPAIISSGLLIFLPETPKALILQGDDYQVKAVTALKSLRNRENVDEEFEELCKEIDESRRECERAVDLRALFTQRVYRWPLITSLILHSAQQFCGINSIYFYSSSIYKSAGIPDEFIQYAILSTGVAEFLSLFLAVKLIEKAGRKLLTLISMTVIIFNFVALVLFLTFKDKSVVLSYLCLASILVFILSFGLSLGPIPYLYSAEVFRQNARSTAMSACIVINWVANLITTVAFPYLIVYIHQYVFLVYVAIMLVFLLVLYKKMVETKKRTIEEVMEQFKENIDHEKNLQRF